MIILQLNTATGEDTIEASLFEDNKLLGAQTLSCDGADAQHVLEGLMTLCDGKILEGIVLIQGAQRFTVSRLGGVVANALALSLTVPVASFSEETPSWEKITTQLHNAHTKAPILYSKAPTIG